MAGGRRGYSLLLNKPGAGASRGLPELVAISTMTGSSCLMFSAMGSDAHSGVSRERSLDIL